ncbi:MAG TPA: hypothetical protein VHZ99_01030 [Steroidobacteraceae bacterium]|jgi:cytochrome c-type biogenesis protein CcmH|nr:hypothetical protein [Steroidobacteraceae bacterium]
MNFSRRDLFWYCAGVLTVVVAGFLLHVLDGSQNSAPAPLHDMAASAPAPAETSAPTGAGTAAGDSGASVPSDAAPVLPHADRAAGSGGAAGSMDDALARLETRLAQRGGSDSDWELLAQSYDFVGRTSDAKLARAHRLPDGAASSATQSAAAAPKGTEAVATATAGTDSVSTLSGDVQLAAGLRKQVADGQTLFIIAKSVDSPGPPLAIFRTVTGQWPLRFTLDDSNAMLPGRNLSSAQHVSIEARVSRSGGAKPESGDFQSPVAPVDPHAARTLHLVIDHVIG